MLGQSNVKVFMGIGHPIHSHDVNRCMGTGCFALTDGTSGSNKTDTDGTPAARAPQ